MYVKRFICGDEDETNYSAVKTRFENESGAYDPMKVTGICLYL